MQTNKSKTEITQLPAQVVAELQSLFWDTGNFFDAQGWSDVNGLLTELLVSCAVKDPNYENRKRIDLSNGVYLVHTTLTFLRDCKKNIAVLHESSPGFNGKNLGVLKILDINFEDLEGNIFYCLSSWIYRDDKDPAEKPDLNLICSISRQFLQLSDWLFCIDQFYKDSKGGLQNAQ